MKPRKKKERAGHRAGHSAAFFFFRFEYHHSNQGMKSAPTVEEDLKQATASIAGHAGVVGVVPLPGTTAFEIEFADDAR